MYSIVGRAGTWVGGWVGGWAFYKFLLAPLAQLQPDFKFAHPYAKTFLPGDLSGLEALVMTEGFCLHHNIPISMDWLEVLFQFAELINYFSNFTNTEHSCRHLCDSLPKSIDAMPV